LMKISGFSQTGRPRPVNEPAAKSAFPTDFVWGSGTAAYQIEGAIAEGGRGPSIWDTFSATPGKVLNGDTGAVACDSYHRWREDIALMGELNLKNYRFSVAWPRIIPGGRGQVNQRGLDFYDRLTDELLAAGITPYLTLYHWDLPQALEDQGGWANRETAYAFAEYAEVVSRRLGDRIPSYTTLNEPWCSSYLGYRIGVHAPGKQDQTAEVAAIHHLLLAHGLALPEVRRNAPRAEVGITLNLSPFQPASNSPADQQAAQTAQALFNGLYLEPLFRGKYSQTYLESLPPGLTFPVQPGDMEIIAQPVDFLGINYYNRQVIQAVPGLPAGQIFKPEGIYTTMGWEVYPAGLFDLLEWLHRTYRLPRYYITENGASGEENPDPDGRVRDNLRLEYYQGHLAQARRVIEAGIPLAGYFAWSLLDNFEWAFGYSRRFGIVYVDFDTQQRTIKDSGRWYGQVAAANALE
jgi:beta-glucosidase